MAVQLSVFELGRRQRHLGPRAFGRLILVVAALSSLHAWCFVAPGRFSLSRNVSKLQRSAGFSEEVSTESTEKGPKVKSSISREQLEADHGDKWEMVDSILKGQKAESPEAIMRARFTALKFKDPQFLASTEKDENLSIRKRNEQWAQLLGLTERSLVEDLLNFMNKDIEALKEPKSFEVVAADEDMVEFKIRCANGKTLHEKSKFEKDRKWGYVYTGDSEFGNWS